MSNLAEVADTTVDGVHTIWAPCAGPLRAELRFRVGSADETYLTSGISHLVEHLALFGIEDPAHHHNGYVDQSVACFHTYGSEDDVIAFLDRVCTQISALPLHRLELERRVLAAERASRARSLPGLALALRYGAAGYGLMEMGRQGERLVRADDVQQWADRYFTRANAVLLLTGPPPAGLRLPLKVHGHRVPAPTPLSLLPPQPSWVGQDVGGIAVSSIIKRHWSNPLVLHVLQQALVKRLRTDRALTYSPTLSYAPLDADWAHLLAFADADKANYPELSTQLAGVMTDLATLRPLDVTEARQAWLTLNRRAEVEHADEYAMQILRRNAEDRLFRRNFSHGDELEQQPAPALVTEFRQRTQEITQSALYVLPNGAKYAEVFGQLLANSLVAPVAGKEYRHRDAPVVKDTLVLSPEGVTRMVPSGSATVRFSSMVAAMRYPDGALCLVGRDGTHLMVEPQLWSHGSKAVGHIGGWLGTHTMPLMPTRSAEEIPRPQTTWWDRFKEAQAAGGNGGWLMVALAVVVVLLISGRGNVFVLFAVEVALLTSWTVLGVVLRSQAKRRRH